MPKEKKSGMLAQIKKSFKSKFMTTKTTLSRGKKPPRIDSHASPLQTDIPRILKTHAPKNPSLAPIIDSTFHAYPITVIGTGYVGLVMGTAFAEFGHTVHCVDINQEKINLLNTGIVPIYEPELEEVLKKNKSCKRLIFSTNIEMALKQSKVIFLAVGTPMLADGTADVSGILASVKTIADVLRDQTYRVICIKSTVPIGTAAAVKKMLSQLCPQGVFDIVSNPEFLREGCALKDFMMPDRIVLGSSSEKALTILKEIYQPLLQRNIPLFITDNITAETIKYASNAFLAVKLAYINEIADFCEKTGANIFDVAHGMGLDSRIGNKFLTPGPGFGGSCFPKDSTALLKKAAEVGTPLRIVQASLDANKARKKGIVPKLKNLVAGSLSGKTIAVLGLAFKANTDDIRESAALDVIYDLLQEKAYIKAYDPLAIENMQKIIPDIYYAHSAEDALHNADAALVLTEWQEFKTLNYQIPILDTRNIVKK
jgi:UDPglucose 6-dehydrogenase